MSDTRHTNVLIIGSGPAGYTAGVYAAAPCWNPILVQGIEPGGQLTTTTEVENWPGDTEVQGPDLMVRMEAHARAMGCEIIGDIITSLDLSKRPVHRAIRQRHGLYRRRGDPVPPARAPNGWACRPRTNSRALASRACATCDGFFYRGQEIVVVGGGNTAVEEALFLTNFASKVTLIHRRDELRAEKILQDRLIKNPKIEPLWFHQLEEVYGSDSPLGVEGVQASSTPKPARSRISPPRACSLPSAMRRANELVKDQLETAHAAAMSRSQARQHRHIDPRRLCRGRSDRSHLPPGGHSAGMGCMAALEAEQLLAEQDDCGSALCSRDELF